TTPRAPVSVVSQVVDDGETRTARVGVNAGQIFKVDIVNGKRITSFFIGIAVNETEAGAADAADGRNMQFHRPGLHRYRLCTLGQQMVISLARIFYAERHAACRGAMLAGEIPGR